MSVFLAIDAENIDARASRPALGFINISIDGVAFPSHDWSDFVVVVLSWWLEATRSLLTGESNREIVNFMDGPYAVEIEKKLNDVLLFTALAGSGRRIVLAVGEEAAMPFAQSLIAQSKAALDACRYLGWNSPDLESMERSLGALERLFISRH